MEWNIVNLCTLISALTAAIVSIINAWKNMQTHAKLDENTTLTIQASHVAVHNCELAKTAVRHAEAAVSDARATQQAISNVVNQIQNRGTT